MNRKIISMIICILLIGITLLSLGLSYSSYQSGLEKIDEKWAELDKKIEKEEIEKEKKLEEEYQREMEIYEEKKRKQEEEERIARENGEFYYPERIIEPLAPSEQWDLYVSDDRYDELESQEEEIYNDFKSKVIIHSIIIGFLIISELGVLLVLPKRKSSIDLTIK